MTQSIKNIHTVTDLIVHLESSCIPYTIMDGIDALYIAQAFKVFYPFNPERISPQKYYLEPSGKHATHFVISEGDLWAIYGTEKQSTGNHEWTPVYTPTDKVVRISPKTEVST